MEQKNCDRCGYIADATAIECPACNGTKFGEPYQVPEDEPTLQWGQAGEPTAAWTAGRLAVNATDNTNWRRRVMPVVAGVVLAGVLAVGTMVGSEPTTVNAESGTQVAIAPSGSPYDNSVELPVSPSEVTVLPQEQSRAEAPVTAAPPSEPVVTITPVYPEDVQPTAPARPRREIAPSPAEPARAMSQRAAHMAAQGPMMAQAPVIFPPAPTFGPPAAAAQAQPFQPPVQQPVQQPAEELAPSMNLFAAVDRNSAEVVSVTQVQPGVNVVND